MCKAKNGIYNYKGINNMFFRIIHLSLLLLLGCTYGISAEESNKKESQNKTDFINGIDSEPENAIYGIIQSEEGKNKGIHYTNQKTQGIELIKGFKLNESGIEILSFSVYESSPHYEYFYQKFAKVWYKSLEGASKQDNGQELKKILKNYNIPEDRISSSFEIVEKNFYNSKNEKYMTGLCDVPNNPLFGTVLFTKEYLEEKFKSKPVEELKSFLADDNKLFMTLGEFAADNVPIRFLFLVKSDLSVDEDLFPLKEMNLIHYKPNNKPFLVYTMEVEPNNLFLFPVKNLDESSNNISIELKK